MRNLALWILAVLVFTIPSENILVVANGSATKLIGVFAFLVGLIALYRENSLKFKPPSFFLIAVSLFVFWGLLSYYWSFNPPLTVSRTVTFVQLLMLAWLIWEFGRTESDRSVLMQSYVLGGYLALGIVVARFFGPSMEFRDFGEGIDANDFSVVLALGIPMAWRLTLLLKNRFVYWLNFLYLPCAVMGIVIAASRGGFISALVALSIVPFTFSQLSTMRRLGLLLLLSSSTWLLFFYAPRILPDLQTNLERLSETSSELKSGTLTGRRLIWAAGLEVFSNHPYVGVGQGGFRLAIEPLYGKPMSSHNAYLSILVDTGIVGFALFTLVVAAIAVPAATMKFPQRPFVLVTLATLLISAFSLNAEGYKYTWFVLALLACEVPLLIISVQNEAFHKGRLMREA